MITIWDMIVNSRYPIDDGYIYIGMIVFSLSILVSVGILPFVVYFLWDIVKPLLRRQALFRNNNYDFHQFLITLSLFVAVILLNVLTMTMGIHGIYFLNQIKVNKNLIPSLREGVSGDESIAYIIPSSHYVLYFLEAAHEAARENLLLWGFLFLANFICKLIAKNFYFKTFTVLLVVRVVFVFICHFNLWELTFNRIGGGELIEMAYALIPFHTFAKLLRTFEILLNILVYIPFMFYLRKIVKEKLIEFDQRPEGQGVSIYDTLTNRLCNRVEMVFIRKYMNVYTFLLIVEFLLDLIESQLPNFIIKYFSAVSVNDVIIIEMVFAVFNQLLSLCLPLLSITFIILLINSMRQKGSSQDDQQNYGSIEEAEDLSNIVSASLNNKLLIRRILVNTAVISIIALTITMFSSYLSYMPGSRAHIVLKPGDYIRLDDVEDTSLGEFMSSCDRVTAALNVTRQFTIFDLDLLVTSIDNSDSWYNCEASNSVIFHNGYTREQIYTVQEERLSSWDIQGSDPKWYPNGTYLAGFNANLTLTFYAKSYQLPCYSYEYGTTGFVVTCDTSNSSEAVSSCNASTADNTRCYIRNDIVLTYGTDDDLNDTKVYEIDLHIPKYNGTGEPYSYTNIGNEDIKKLKLIEYLEIKGGASCHIYFECHFKAWKTILLVLALFSAVFFYLTLALVCLSKTLFRNWNIS